MTYSYLKYLNQLTLTLAMCELLYILPTLAIVWLYYYCLLADKNNILVLFSLTNEMVYLFRYC